MLHLLFYVRVSFELLWNMLPQWPIGFLCHRFALFGGGILAGNLHCQMREPAIGGSTMPVLDLRGNIYYISRMRLPGGALKNQNAAPKTPPLLLLKGKHYRSRQSWQTPPYCRHSWKCFCVHTAKVLLFLQSFAIIIAKEAATHTGRKAHDDL